MMDTSIQNTALPHAPSQPTFSTDSQHNSISSANAQGLSSSQPTTATSTSPVQAITYTSHSFTPFTRPPPPSSTPSSKSDQDSNFIPRTHISLQSEILIISGVALMLIFTLSVCYVFRCRKKRVKKDWSGPLTSHQQRAGYNMHEDDSEQGSPGNEKYNRSKNGVYDDNDSKGSNDRVLRLPWLPLLGFTQSGSRKRSQSPDREYGYPPTHQRRQRGLAESRPPQENLPHENIENSMLRPSMDRILTDAFSTDGVEGRGGEGGRGGKMSVGMRMSMGADMSSWEDEVMALSTSGAGSEHGGGRGDRQLGGWDSYVRVGRGTDVSRPIYAPSLPSALTSPSSSASYSAAGYTPASAYASAYASATSPQPLSICTSGNSTQSSTMTSPPAYSTSARRRGSVNTGSGGASAYPSAMTTMGMATATRPMASYASTTTTMTTTTRSLTAPVDTDASAMDAMDGVGATVMATTSPTLRPPRVEAAQRYSRGSYSYMYCL